MSRRTGSRIFAAAHWIGYKVRKMLVMNMRGNMAKAFEDVAPTGPELTDYDRAHIKLYARLLDATADGADLREIVSVLFGLDAEQEPERARQVHDSHLARARWLAASGYKHLLNRSD